MKFIIFLLLLGAGFYMSTSDADTTYTIYLEDEECSTSYVSKGESFDQYTSARSRARCNINESKNEMRCSFNSLDDGSSQGSEVYKIKKNSKDRMDVISKETFTLMQVELKKGKYTYHFTGFRKFQHKLVTQVCHGKIH